MPDDGDDGQEDEDGANSPRKTWTCLWLYLNPVATTTATPTSMNVRSLPFGVIVAAALVPAAPPMPLPKLPCSSKADDLFDDEEGGDRRRW